MTLLDNIIDWEFSACVVRFQASSAYHIAPAGVLCHYDMAFTFLCGGFWLKLNLNQLASGCSQNNQTFYFTVSSAMVQSGARLSAKGSSTVLFILETLLFFCHHLIAYNWVEKK